MREGMLIYQEIAVVETPGARRNVLTDTRETDATSDGNDAVAPPDGGGCTRSTIKVLESIRGWRKKKRHEERPSFVSVHTSLRKLPLLRLLLFEHES